MIPKYSFVIPHYNIPSLLNRCLDSIPVRPDIQIIVVDDGSTNKPFVTRRDVKLILLEKHTNAGHARNVGLVAAEGRWVLFPDADDFYNEGFISCLDKYANSDNQVVFFSVNSRNSKTMELTDERSRVLAECVENAYSGDEESLMRLFYCQKSVWYMMFSREYLQFRGIHFDEVPIHNDVLFHLNSCYHLTSVASQSFC